MNSDLVDRWRSESLQTDTIVRAKFVSLSQAQLNWSPNAETWTIGQQFEHLRLANESYEKILGEWKSTSKIQSQPYRPGFWGRILRKAVAPDSKMYAPVPKPLKPPKKQYSSEVVEQYLQLQDHFYRYLESARSLDLNQPFRSPFMPIMKLKIGDVFGVIVLHNERHVRSSMKLLNDADFPH